MEPLTYFLSPKICLFWTFHINGNIQSVILCVCLLSHSILFSEFIVSCFIKKSVFYSFLWLNNIPLMNIPHFIHSIVEHFRYLHFLTIMNTVARSTWVQVFMWTYVFSSYLSRSGIAGSYGNSMCNCLRNCQMVFQSSCTMLHYVFCNSSIWAASS